MLQFTGEELISCLGEGRESTIKVVIRTIQLTPLLLSDKTYTQFSWQLSLDITQVAGAGVG